MKKYEKEKLERTDVIELYKMILEEKDIKTFPKGFWQQPEAKQNAAKCIKYLIEEVLKYDNKIIKEKLSSELFYKYKLRGMLSTCFNGRIYEAINSAYPNRFKEWEFKYVPVGFWENEQNRINAIKWLVEKKLKFNEADLKEQLSYKLFKDNGLGGLLAKYFGASPYKAINAAYPNKFKEWEFKNVSRGFWDNKQNAIYATKWLIEEKLKLNDEDLKKELSFKSFSDNKLDSMLKYCFNNSPYEALEAIYPNKFKAWELKSVPKNYWNKKTGIEATKWLIEEKLKLNDEELKELLSFNLFKENGLRGMLQYCFNDSPYKAINAAYPNKFKKNDFKGYINKL